VSPPPAPTRTCSLPVEARISPSEPYKRKWGTVLPNQDSALPLKKNS
jgi:hypothetical protein